MPRRVYNSRQSHSHRRRRHHRRKKRSVKSKFTTYRGRGINKTQSREIVRLNRRVDTLMRRPEYKWVEEQFNANISSDIATPFGGTGTQIWSITMPPQGTTCNERIGDKCYLKKWTLRFKLNGTSDTVGAQDTENIIRIIIACDKQAVNTENGTTNPLKTETNFVGFSNVLQKTTFTGSAGLVSPLKRNYDTSVNGCPFRERWSIYHDGLYRVGVDSQDYASSSPHQVIKQIDVPLHNMKVAFEKSEDNPADKALYVFAVSDSSVSDHPDGIFYSILSFTDT